jgi:hypothetical protein
MVTLSTFYLASSFIAINNLAIELEDAALGTETHHKHTYTLTMKYILLVNNYKHGNIVNLSCYIKKVNLYRT